MTNSIPLERPLVSIVVRTCPGRSGMARAALESIIAQTWRPLEVIVAEDGGDSAAAWLGELDSRDVQVRHLPLPKRGRCAAGNAGLEATSGVMLGFLDDDDLLWPAHVELLASTLLAAPDCVATYAFAVETPTIVQNWMLPTFREQPGYIVHRQPYSRELLMQKNYLPIQSVLFRRDLFEAHGGFDVELDQLEDWDLWRRYSSAGPFCLVPQATSMYRVPGTADDAFLRHRALSRYRSKANSRRRIDAAQHGMFGKQPAFSLRSAAKSVARYCLQSNRWTYRGYWHARRAFYCWRTGSRANSG